jgi:F0F1-type ATP synthase beta subunit
MNVIGEPVDERGPINVRTDRAIHAPAPEFIDQSTDRDPRHRYQGHRPARPYSKGGKIGLFGGAGVGKTVLIHGTDQQHRQAALGATRSSPAWASGRAKATTSTTR